MRLGFEYKNINNSNKFKEMPADIDNDEDNKLQFLTEFGKDAEESNKLNSFLIFTTALYAAGAFVFAAMIFPKIQNELTRNFVSPGLLILQYFLLAEFFAGVYVYRRISYRKFLQTALVVFLIPLIVLITYIAVNILVNLIIFNAFSDFISG